MMYLICQIRLTMYPRRDDNHHFSQTILAAGFLS